MYHPQLRLHLSVQGSASNFDAINFYREQFGVVRAVLPRVLSLTQVQQVIEKRRSRSRSSASAVCASWWRALCPVELCDGRIAQHPRRVLATQTVRWVGDRQRGAESRLNGVLIDRYAPGENAATPRPVQGPL